MSNEKNTEGLNLSKHYASVLVKPTETVIATYGNDYFQNIVVSKNLRDFSFILTDKRLYFKGTRFQGVGAGIGTTIVEENLDLKEITKSGFEYFNFNPVGWYIFGIISIVFGILMTIGLIGSDHPTFIAVLYEILSLPGYAIGITFLASGYLGHINNTFTAIKFDYAGGSLCGNIKLYGEASARDFLKQVKRAQDEYK